MIDEDGPPTILIPARRILVVDDLGTVRKGDHVLMVGNVVVSVDTSRPDVSLAPERLRLAHTSEPKKKSPKIEDITSKLLIKTLRENQGPMSSMEISDHLGLDRKDNSRRPKVTRVLSQLLQEGSIQRVPDNPSRYKLPHAEPIQPENWGATG